MRVRAPTNRRTVKSNSKTYIIRREKFQKYINIYSTHRYTCLKLLFASV